MKPAPTVPVPLLGKAPSTRVASSAATAVLPLDLLQKAAQRLGAMAWTYATTYIVATVAANVVRHGLDDHPFTLNLGHGIAVLFTVLAVGVALVARSSLLSPR